MEVLHPLLLQGKGQTEVSEESAHQKAQSARRVPFLDISLSKELSFGQAKNWALILDNSKYFA
jgi:hypothetical protein